MIHLPTNIIYSQFLRDLRADIFWGHYSVYLSLVSLWFHLWEKGRRRHMIEMGWQTGWLTENKEPASVWRFYLASRVFAVCIVSSEFECLLGWHVYGYWFHISHHSLLSYSALLHTIILHAWSLEASMFAKSAFKWVPWKTRRIEELGHMGISVHLVRGRQKSHDSCHFTPWGSEEH